MTKVLFVNSILWPGGVEKTLLNITNQLAMDNKYEITILTIYEDKRYKAYINENVKYKYIFKSLQLDGIKKKIYTKIQHEILMKFCYFINKYFIGSKYDIVIGFTEGFPTKIVSYTKVSKKIAWIHTDFKDFRWSYNQYKNELEERKAYEAIDKIICVSDVSKKHFLEIYDYREKTQLIYNLLDENKILELANERCDYIKYEKNMKYIIYIGRFAAIKRVDRLIEAFSLLIKEVDDVTLILIGDGVLRERIEDQINNLQLNDNVIFLGVQDNPYRYLKRSTVLVSSSDSECAPVTICESLLLGIPVVTTNCPGSVEMIGGGKFGIVVEKNSISLYKGLKRILEDDSIYNNYKKEIEERNKYMTSPKIIEQLKSIL